MHLVMLSAVLGMPFFDSGFRVVSTPPPPEPASAGTRRRLSSSFTLDLKQVFKMGRSTVPYCTDWILPSPVTDPRSLVRF